MVAGSKILLFTTGGTIATIEDAGDESRVPRLKGNQILEMLARPQDGCCDIDVVELGLVPSTAITPRLAFDWACEVERRLSSDNVDGAVVTMGTNAMEETAYLFDLKINTQKRIVFTGSMMLPTDPSSDATRNLATSVVAASDRRLAGMGVVLVMNDEVHLAQEVTKVDSHALNAFVSPVVGPIGRFLNGDADSKPRLRIDRRADSVVHPDASGLEDNVGYVKAVLGCDGRLVDALVDQGVRGIVIEAFGEGSTTIAMAPAIERAIKAGVVIVIASRAITGGTLPKYTELGESKWLADRGALFAGKLSGPKARIRLMFALAGDSRNAIRSWFPEGS